MNSEYVTQTQRRAALLDVRGARVRLRGNDAENCSAIVRAGSGRPRVCALNRGRHLKVGILFIANGLIRHPRHQTGVHTDAVTTNSSYTCNRVHRAFIDREDKNPS